MSGNNKSARGPNGAEKADENARSLDVRRPAVPIVQSQVAHGDGWMDGWMPMAGRILASIPEARTIDLHIYARNWALDYWIPLGKRLNRTAPLSIHTVHMSVSYLCYVVVLVSYTTDPSTK